MGRVDLELGHMPELRLVDKIVQLAVRTLRVDFGLNSAKICECSLNVS